jgi:hypothetical protein
MEPLIYVVFNSGLFSAFVVIYSPAEKISRYCIVFNVIPVRTKKACALQAFVYGRPGRFRTADLYRVKVALSP